MSIFNKIKESLSKPVIVRVKMKRSFTIGNIIFSGKDRSDDVLVHETSHVSQQSGINNPFLNPSWILRYAFDKNFRWRKEREGITVQIQYRQRNNIPTDYGTLYSSIIRDYNKMVDSNTAMQFVLELQETDRAVGSVYLA